MQTPCHSSPSSLFFLSDASICEREGAAAEVQIFSLPGNVLVLNYHDTSEGQPRSVGTQEL